MKIIIEREFIGVGIVYRDTMEPYRINYTQHNSRIITAKFKLHGPPLTIINQAAPQDAHKDQRIKSTTL